MVNQELLDFIKIQLSRGFSKEAITSDLLVAGGWTEQDIQEGFNNISNTVINQAIPSNLNNSPLDQNTINCYYGKKAVFIIVFLFVIGVVVFGYYFRSDIPVIKDFMKSKNYLPVNEIKPEDNSLYQIQKEEVSMYTKEQDENLIIPESTVQSVSNTKTENKKVVVASPQVKTPTEPSEVSTINCGTEMKCFIGAVKTCTPAFVEETKTIDFFDVYSITNKTKMTLAGYDSSKKCIYSSKVISANIDYSPKIKSSPEYMAATEAEKKEDLDKLNESVKNTIGMTTKCLFTTTYLSDILAKWSKGEYSSEDYKPENCTTTDSTGKEYPMM